MGAIIYNNKTAKEIAQKIDGKVEYVFVDIEKKINNRLDILVNIERSTKEVINKSIVKIINQTILQLIQLKILYKIILDQI